MRDRQGRSWPLQSKNPPPEALVEAPSLGKTRMDRPPFSRRQVAILAADVAGYSRLLATDEWATVATLDAYRAVFHERVAQHGGRIVDTAGDSVLAVFPAAIAAVEAALGIQDEIDERNDKLPRDLRMRFRLGINFGTVIEKDDGTVYGLDVNVASHLESLSEPGGTAISEGVLRRVIGRVSQNFKDIGEHQVKNITRAVRAFQAASSRADGKTQTQAGKRRAHG